MTDKTFDPTKPCPYCGGDESKCDFSFYSGMCSQMANEPTINAALYRRAAAAKKGTDNK